MTLSGEYFWNPDQAAQGERARVGTREGGTDGRPLRAPKGGDERNWGLNVGAAGERKGRRPRT